MQTDKWIKFQKENSKKISLENSFDVNTIKYIGGVDISFSKSDPLLVCGYLTIIDYQSGNIVYEDYYNTNLTIPYVCGFLGFREVPIYTVLIDRLNLIYPEFYPSVIMVDGCGILHPRNFGSASHLGIVYEIPTIGVSKTLLCIDGLNKKISNRNSKKIVKTKVTILI